MEKTAISVKIYNETYKLYTEAPTEEVTAVAELVDKKMQELVVAKNIQNREKVAVWIALDLAAELYSLRNDYNKLLALAKER